MAFGVAGLDATALEDATVEGGLSSSVIFCSKAARAAACRGLSSARTESEPAHKATAHRVVKNFVILISIFYANSFRDATAFPPRAGKFRHTPGSG